MLFHPVPMFLFSFQQKRQGFGRSEGQIIKKLIQRCRTAMTLSTATPTPVTSPRSYPYCHHRWHRGFTGASYPLPIQIEPECNRCWTKQQQQRLLQFSSSGGSNSCTSRSSGFESFDNGESVALVPPPLPPDSLCRLYCESHIVALLQDVECYPPGSLSPSLIADAEKALQVLADYRSLPSSSSSSSTTPKDRAVALEHAMFLLNRLVQEQLHQNPLTTKPTRMDGDYRLFDRKDSLDQGENDDDEFYHSNHHHNNHNYRNNLSSDRFLYTVRPFLLNRVVDFWKIVYVDDGSTT